MPRDAETWGVHFAFFGAACGFFAPIACIAAWPVYCSTGLLVGLGTGYVVGRALHTGPRGWLTVPVGLVVGAMWGAFVGCVAGVAQAPYVGTLGGWMPVYGLVYGGTTGAVTLGALIWPYSRLVEQGRDATRLLIGVALASPIFPTLMILAEDMERYIW